MESGQIGGFGHARYPTAVKASAETMFRPAGPGDPRDGMSAPGRYDVGETYIPIFVSRYLIKAAKAASSTWPPIWRRKLFSRRFALMRFAGRVSGSSSSYTKD